MKSTKTNETKAAKVAVFMMGGPASGKTRVRNEQYAALLAIDCDSFKESHPDYDPKDPAALHSWSAAEARKAFFTAIGSGVEFVYDGTGSTAEKYVNYIQLAQQAGYVTELVYVSCDLNTALARNAARTRTVPEEVVREKYATIATSFEIVSRYADSVRVIG